MVGVPVRGDDPGEPVVADQREQPPGLGGGVDEDLLAGLPAPKQVRVVVVGADRELAQGQVGQLAGLGGPAGVDFAGVAGHRVLTSMSAGIASEPRRLRAMAGAPGSARPG